MTPGRATARACANIALVKYWGKRDRALNLPAAGSLSLTLAALTTETTVELDPSLSADELVLDGQPARPVELTRVTAFLDVVRATAGIGARARVATSNAFPTAAGLASSASGYAALALAATTAAGLTMSPRALSILARQGSGSAARSIYGAFVRMHAGELDDGSDAFAEPVSSPLADRVRMVIAIVGGGAPKSHGSRDAMDHTTATSPFYPAWIETVRRDLGDAEGALAAGDLTLLGTIAEANALAMHATALAARPAVIYWQPTTLSLLAEVRALRARGIGAWATMDAGPHVKVLTSIDQADAVANALRTVPGASEIMISGAGGPATVTG